MVQFGDVEPFLQSNEDVGPTLRLKLLDILLSSQSKGQLILELAAVVNVGEHFVKSTYNLEGDGPLAITCFEEIVKLREVIRTSNFPNVNAIAAFLSPGNNIMTNQQILTTQDPKTLML